MRGNEALKLGGERGGRVGGRIQLRCSWGGHLPGRAWLSPIPSPHFSSTRTPPPSIIQTSACLSQCPSEDICTGLVCNPVIFYWPEYAQILSRVCCIELGVYIPRKQT